MTYTATTAQQLLRATDRALQEPAALTVTTIEGLLARVESACRDFAYVSATSDVTGKRIMLADLREALWKRLEEAGE
jgi:hypothetical protein